MYKRSIGDLIYIETDTINYVGFYRGISIYKNKYEKIDELLTEEEQFGFLEIDLIYYRNKIIPHQVALASIEKIEKIEKRDLSNLYFACKPQAISWFDQLNIYTCLTHPSEAIRKYAQQEFTETF